MEIFGPVIQGEGSVIGRKTMFVRTGGCDYSCSWCDSAFTWNGEEKATMMLPEEIFDEIEKLGTTEFNGELRRNYNHVTLTGGNPALIQKPMENLIDLLKEKGIQVGLETQGSIWRDWFYKIDDMVLSPKPPSSKMKTNIEVLDGIVTKLYEKNKNLSLKVVIFDEQDLEYAKKIHTRYPYVDFYLSVGNSDSKESGDISGRLLKQLEWLWDKVLADPDFNNVRPLPQLHTLVYGNARKV